MAIAQTNDQYQFRHINISNGLSHDQVNCIFKDSKGFIWFGTMSGLNRFDGYKVKVFRHDFADSASLDDDYISKICEGPGGKLWIQTRSSFNNIYDPLTEKFTRHSEKFMPASILPPTGLTNIVKSSTAYWLLYSGIGLYKIDFNGKTTGINIPGNNSLTGAQVTDISLDKKGNLWIVHANGLLQKLDTQQNKVVFSIAAIKNENKEGAFYNMFIDAQDEIWLFVIATVTGVYHYIPVTNTIQHFSKDNSLLKLNNDLVYAITQDDKGFIWIGTDHGGINIIDKKNNAVQFITNQADDDKSISQNSIYALYKDNTGIIWAGTFKNGINYYHENMIKFPLYKRQTNNAEGLQFNDINRFAEDAQGNLWIGTNGGGLFYFNRKTNSFKRYKHDAGDGNSLTNDIIVSLWIDDEQKLWIGTYFGGLDCYNGKTFTHYRHNESVPTSLADDRVWEIFQDENKIFWIGTLDGGLDRFDRKTTIFYHHKTGMPNSVHANYISVLMQDNQQNLWVGTSDGVDVLMKNTGRFVHYSGFDKLSHNNVNAILKDHNGNIWVGTRDGLNVFDTGKKTFQSFKIKDGLPDNTIWNILEDNDNNIWVSTSGGLSKIKATGNPATGFKIQCNNFDELDGLQAKEFNDNAALKLKSGELAFGGPGGFNIFDPATIKDPDNNMDVLLTDLEVFNKSVLPGEKINGNIILNESITEAKEITLNYDQNIFFLEFAAPNFSHPQKSVYAYKLDGFNKDWLVTDANNRKATFTNLDPGSYTFRVKAGNGDGTWSTHELVLKINILPPFWQTDLAYFIYFLIVAIALYTGRLMVIQKAKTRFAIGKEREEAHRMHELDMMKIKFFTNVSHEFRTPLTLIITPLDKIIKNTAEPSQKQHFQLIQRNARRLLNMVNQLLDFRKLEAQEIRLNLSQGDMVQFVKESVLCFADIAEKKHIRLLSETSIPVLEATFDKDKVERILFNLLSNAFKFTPDNGTITVTTNKFISTDAAGNEIIMAEIKVRDTGIGIPEEKQEKIFDHFFQLDIPDSMINQGSGIGLSITKEFVRLHHGKITVQSIPNKATCFTILLPVMQTNGIKYVNENNSAQIFTEALSLHQQLTGYHENETGPKTRKKKQAILLVEDNEDFRFYLKDNLRSIYHIIEAGNGNEAWDKILHHHPDLIVSDVNMPEMNGIQLCKKIKGDKQTSHIPVILLTARSAEEHQLEGYQTGANDYMPKPFNFEILQSRIKNLLDQQESLRRLFQKQLDVNPTEITITSVDEKFIQQALEIVENNIANPDFSVEDLSRQLFMSRVSLYKKINSLTGKGPLEFIRSIRLKRAARLLEKSQLTIAEIAYEVGFNNPKYFAKFFKEEFGILPSVYILQHAKK